jgi:hypothetical protein
MQVSTSIPSCLGFVPFPTEIFIAFLISPIPSTCPVYLILLNFNAVIVFGDACTMACSCWTVFRGHLLVSNHELSQNVRFSLDSSFS